MYVLGNNRVPEITGLFKGKNDGRNEISGIKYAYY